MAVIVVPLALVLWTLVLAGVALGLRLRRGQPTRPECALEELAARYACGEIDASEYRRRHRALGGGRAGVIGASEGAGQAIQHTAGAPGINGAGRPPETGPGPCTG